MVVRLVLEHQQPLLGLPVHIDIYEYAAGVVLLADLQVVQQAFLPEILGTDRGHIHQIEAFLLAAGLGTHLQVEVQSAVDVLLDEGLLHIDALQLGREGGVAAVVAPVGVQNPQFGLVGVAAFLGEVLHHLGEVVGIHRQTHLPAICSQIFSLHIPESLEDRNRLDGRVFGVREFREVLDAGLDRVDAVVADLLQGLLRSV